MKSNKHPIDDFFRESLQEYKLTPSGKARKRFLDATAGPGLTGNAGQYRWYYIVSGIALIISAVILYFMTINHPDSMHSENIFKTNDIQIAAVSPVSKTNISSPVSSPDLKNDNKIKTRAIVSNANNKAPGNSKKPVVQKGQTLTGTSSTSFALAENPAITDNKTVPDVIKKEPESDTRSATQTQTTETVQAGYDRPAQTDEPLPVTSENNKENPDPVEKPQGLSPTDLITPPLTWNFTPFLKYNFEWVFDKKKSQKINTFGIEGELRHGRFSLKTGIGLSITDASDNVQVQYNDYLGSYRKLDSLTFSWDANHYYLLPSYYMSDKNVWDSALSLDYYQVTKRYSLVQVPLIFGYSVLQSNQFTIGINAGLNFAFYANSKKLTGDYSTGQNRIIEINPMAADLMRTNCFFITNIGFSYKLMRGIYLELEPGLKYLLNPTEERKKGRKNIYMPEIRASIKIKLN